MTLSMVEEDGGGISFLSMRSEIPRASFQVAASNQPSDSTLHLDINHVVSLSQVIPQVVRWHVGCVDVHHLHACMANDDPRLWLRLCPLRLCTLLQLLFG